MFYLNELKSYLVQNLKRIVKLCGTKPQKDSQAFDVTVAPLVEYYKWGVVLVSLFSD